MVPIVTATQFQRFMSSGRTEPAIFGCEDEAGAWAGEFVVKLRGGLETGESGLLRELMATKLASYFGLASPEPALVHLEQAVAELVTKVEPSHAARLRASVGLNFGTKVVLGFSTWPVDKFIPDTMWQTAINIFTFDALIQNPDRKYGPSPNLFTKGDRILIFDHETAFSFLLDVLPSPTPWRLDNQRYLLDHVFYRRLKSKPIDMSGFTASLVGLSDAVLAAITTDVPAEWNNDSLLKINRHLRTLREHAAEFAQEVQRILV